MFAEGLCSDLPGWTDRQMATWPPHGIFVALTVWLGGARKSCSYCSLSLSITLCCHKFMPPSLTQWPLATRVQLPSKLFSPLQSTGQRKRYDDVTGVDRRFCRRETSKAAAEYKRVATTFLLPIITEKKLLFTIRRPVLMEIAPSMN